MSPRRDLHRFLGPLSEEWVDGRATRWRAVCSCLRWTGPARVSRLRCREDHDAHVEQARQDAEADTAHLADL